MEIRKQYISAEDLFAEVQDVFQMDYEAEFTVTGNSMWPFMRHGRDQVVLQKCDVAQLRKMDIVLFKIEEKYILHRITARKGDLIQTTGDKNCFRDPWVPASSVIGRVTKIKRKGKVLCLEKRRWKFLGAAWNLLFPIRTWVLKLWNLLRR